MFLSLLLHNFSMVHTTKTGNTLNVDSFSCLDSFSKHIRGGMPQNNFSFLFLFLLKTNILSAFDFMF